MEIVCVQTALCPRARPWPIEKSIVFNIHHLIGSIFFVNVLNCSL